MTTKQVKSAGSFMIPDVCMVMTRLKLATKNDSRKLDCMKVFNNLAGMTNKQVKSAGNSVIPWVLLRLW